jgi:hypothetical protein
MKQASFVTSAQLGNSDTVTSRVYDRSARKVVAQLLVQPGVLADTEQL